MLGVGNTTVSDILKRKDEYKGIYEENTTSKRKRHDTVSVLMPGLNHTSPSDLILYETSLATCV
jgi:hypothetical protein